MKNLIPKIFAAVALGSTCLTMASCGSSESAATGTSSKTTMNPAMSEKQQAAKLAHEQRNEGGK